jgi:hypothetical protein
MTQAANLSALGSNVTTSGNLSSASTLSLQTNGTTAITVDTNQNVGIGTTSPSSKLNVNGKVTLIGGEDQQIEWNNNSQLWRLNNSTAGQFYLYDVTGVKFPIQVNAGSGSSSLAITSTYTALGVGGTERMRIDSSGNVLVGTTSYNYGYTGNAVQLSSVFGQPRVILSYATTSAINMIVFNNPNGQVGYINTSGSSTQYSTSSDYRLKENVQPMVGALDKVVALKPVTYTWKADNSAGQGFIAHELQAVVPDCVTGEKDAVDAEGNPQYQGIDTSFLVATLTAAIQELKTIVDAQAARITVLENK